MQNPTRSDLDHLFRKTNYITEFGTIHVGQELPVGIMRWMDDKKKHSLVILSAENPQGISADQAENVAAHRRLKDELTARGSVFIECNGRLDEWREHMVVILGYSKKEALAMAKELNQAAIVWCEREGDAELVWC